MCSHAGLYLYLWISESAAYRAAYSPTVACHENTTLKFPRHMKIDRLHIERARFGNWSQQERTFRYSAKLILITEVFA